MDKAESVAREILKCRKCDGEGWFLGSKLGQNGEPQPSQIQCDNCYQGEIASHSEALIPLITEALKQHAEEAVKEVKKLTWCAYCDFEAPIDADASIITNHVKTCPHHPLNKEISSLKAQLADEKEEVWIKCKQNGTILEKVKVLEQRLAEKEKKLDTAMAVIKNECEHDTKVREEAKKVLSEFEIEGDSYGVPMLEDIAELLVKKIQDLERYKDFVEKYRLHQPQHPDDERSWIPILLDKEQEVKELQARLKASQLVGYKCEHIDKDEIGVDCVHCNLVVAENAVKNLQKKLLNHGSVKDNLREENKELQEKLKEVYKELGFWRDECGHFQEWVGKLQEKLKEAEEIIKVLMSYVKERLWSEAGDYSAEVEIVEQAKQFLNRKEGK